MFKRLTRETPEGQPDALDRMYGIYRLHVGEHEVLVINDGFIGLFLPALAVDVPEAEVQMLMRAHGLGTEFASLPISTVLIRTGNRLVLVDNGLGASDFARNLFGDYTGGLLPTLAFLGISPEAITDVIFSHSHADHIGGTSSDGRLAFPNAQHYLAHAEWEDMQREDIPEFAAPFYAFGRRQLQPLAANEGQLAFYGDEDEVVPGIQAIATVGHSPGHHSFLIESRGQQLLLPCDVLAHHVINLRHPDWPIVPDQIPEGIEARKRLLARATHEQIPILACHFPFPGLGRVTRFGDAYQYVPTS